MRINDVIGLFAALIGSTATLLGAWAYIRSHHPPRKEMLRAGFVITVIMIGILGSAVAISNATTIKVNGQSTVPVPHFLAPESGTTTPTPASTVTSSSTPGSTPPSESTRPPESTPPSGSTPVISSTPPSGSTPIISSTSVSKKG